MRKVYLIAGHNGKGTGACGLFDEGEETIKFRDILDNALCAKNYCPETDFDKEDDKLNEVVRWLTNEVNPDDLCIDIHFNAGASSATGTEVFVPDVSTDFEYNIAKEMCNCISSVLGIKNRGVKKESSSARGKLAMLSGFNCQQILIEICFCTNSSDVDSYQKFKHELAKNLASVIVKHLK